MRRLADAADRALAVLKWPAALIALALLPGLALALVDVLKVVTRTPRHIAPFLAGALMYLVAWWLVLRKRWTGSMFSTAEHELTHALFAWATFHRVVQFRATWREGGHIQFIGQGNWLISVAPYFFPTLSVVAFVLTTVLPKEALASASFALGATVTYHVTSTWRETHKNQPDLTGVGLPFAWCFLPAANALVYGLLLSAVTGGGRAVSTYVSGISTHEAAFFHALGLRI